MAPTPSSKPVSGHSTTPSKTPHSKHRLHFPSAKNTHPSPNPISATKEAPQTDHPVEVIGRIRDYPDRQEKPSSALQICSDGNKVRVRTDIGYRDFSLDGASVSEEEDLDGFYKKFVESRINGVKLGSKCTIMMYGPTGSGKSHTMFGCPKQPGIVYRALRDILGGGEEGGDGGGGGFGFGQFVQVAVLEIYNEEIYDLLSTSNSGGVNLGWPKGTASKVRLEVMGGKAKNAAFISGNEAGKISREVAKVEKRRIVKSTLCNERSSRSHCMIILDVPSVGGRLMLVDMAGSENIEQAGQTGLEAKMQTAKINQGNIALKRVVESIANGDSYVPFRDSKLTMLLQDSFEDDNTKILMILCASPDPKEMHKTISTLEYGAKAKCIIRSTHTPNSKDKASFDDSSSTVLGSRIAAMDQFIFKLQMENKLKEKERNEAHKELLRKEKEMAELRAKLERVEEKRLVSQEKDINSQVDQRTEILKIELEKKLYECQQMENEFVELGRRMEEKILQQQEEVEMLRRRLEEIETELCCSRENECDEAHDIGTKFIKRLSEIYTEGDQGMEKSMDLDTGDEPPVLVVKEINQDDYDRNRSSLGSHVWDIEGDDIDEIAGTKFVEKVYLSTVFEDEEGEEEENTEEEEVKKEVVEEKAIHLSDKIDDMSHPQNILVQTPNSCSRDDSCSRDVGEAYCSRNRVENEKDAASARRTRIHNIFMLCGNHRELAQHVMIPTPSKKKSESTDTGLSPVVLGEESITKPKEPSPLKTIPQAEFKSNAGLFADGTARNITGSPILGLQEQFSSLNIAEEQKFMDTQLNKKHSSEKLQESKENWSSDEDGLLEVYVKWEASKENPGKFITKLKVLKTSSLADLRKLIETHLEEYNNKQSFTFLMLGDPTGAPVVNEKEATIQASKLPICNNHTSSHLASLRPIKKAIQRTNHLPFSSLENKLHLLQTTCQ
ncbi:hypothetical protein MRB53_035458 [Persea americana]|uniref:Uncharacterized protein n=1 Tax=Persea americana TaxID=3435 RepID=A0ACC2K4X6_PERAE|nr:hypothetical protein MRB53_035458 [Persea americana]